MLTYWAHISSASLQLWTLCKAWTLVAAAAVAGHVVSLRLVEPSSSWTTSSPLLLLLPSLMSLQILFLIAYQLRCLSEVEDIKSIFISTLWMDEWMVEYNSAWIFSVTTRRRDCLSFLSIPIDIPQTTTTRTRIRRNCLFDRLVLLGQK